MGDTFKDIGAHAVIISRSEVRNALNRMAPDRNPADEQALAEIVALVERSGSAGAAATLQAFLHELGQAQREPSKLRALWQDIGILVPVLADLPNAAAFVKRVIGI